MDALVRDCQFTKTDTGRIQTKRMEQNPKHLQPSGAISNAARYTNLSCAPWRTFSEFRVCREFQSVAIQGSLHWIKPAPSGAFHYSKAGMPRSRPGDSLGRSQGGRRVGVEMRRLKVIHKGSFVLSCFIVFTVLED